MSRFGLRLLTLLVLLLATPGSADVVQELVSHVSGIECCDEGGCDDVGGECDPSTCLHCTCCAHVTALIVSAGLIAAIEPAAREIDLRWERDRPFAAGVQSAPFRPPAS